MTKSILRSEQGGSSAAAAAPVSVVVDVVTHDTEPSVCSVLSNGGPGHAHHQDTAVGTQYTRNILQGKIIELSTGEGP